MWHDVMGRPELQFREKSTFLPGIVRPAYQFMEAQRKKSSIQRGPHLRTIFHILEEGY